MTEADKTMVATLIELRDQAGDLVKDYKLAALDMPVWVSVVVNATADRIQRDAASLSNLFHPVEATTDD